MLPGEAKLPPDKGEDDCVSLTLLSFEDWKTRIANRLRLEFTLSPRGLSKNSEKVCFPFLSLAPFLSPLATCLVMSNSRPPAVSAAKQNPL